MVCCQQLRRPCACGGLGRCCRESPAASCTCVYTRNMWAHSSKCAAQQAVSTSATCSQIESMQKRGTVSQVCLFYSKGLRHAELSVGVALRRLPPAQRNTHTQHCGHCQSTKPSDMVNGLAVTRGCLLTMRYKCLSRGESTAVAPHAWTVLTPHTQAVSCRLPCSAALGCHPVGQEPATDNLGAQVTRYIQYLSGFEHVPCHWHISPPCVPADALGRVDSLVTLACTPGTCEGWQGTAATTAHGGTLSVSGMQRGVKCMPRVKTRCAQHAAFCRAGVGSAEPTMLPTRPALPGWLRSYCIAFCCC